MLISAGDNFDGGGTEVWVWAKAVAASNINEARVCVMVSSIPEVGVV
jgi:hypothetical protein